jgi:hypothetical protein
VTETEEVRVVSRDTCGLEVEASCTTPIVSGCCVIITQQPAEPETVVVKPGGVPELLVVWSLDGLLSCIVCHWHGTAWHGTTPHGMARDG